MSAQRGGGGVPSKADIVIKLSKGGCVNLRTRGEGVQKSENFADVICVSPLRGKEEEGAEENEQRMMLEISQLGIR